MRSRSGRPRARSLVKVPFRRSPLPGPALAQNHFVYATAGGGNECRVNTVGSRRDRRAGCGES